MAFLDRSLASPSASLAKKEMTFYFNVNHSVGYGLTNNQSDVLLVQLLLTSLFEDPACPVALKPLRIDGIFGKKTHEAILVFQAKLCQGRCAADGKVHRAAGISGDREKAGKRIFTIVAMNKVYAHYNWRDYLDQLPLEAVRNTLSDLAA